MSTKARKDRKRDGIKFEKAQKIGTPVEDRAEFNRMVIGPKGTRYAGQQVPINPKHLKKALAARGIDDK